MKIELTRQEEFVAGRSRHATVTKLKVGAKVDGTITAIHATTIMDTGAYLASGPESFGGRVRAPFTCTGVPTSDTMAISPTPTARLRARTGPWARLRVISPWRSWLTKSPRSWGWTLWTSG